MNNYDAGHTFYGGSSLFIEFHDIIKPVYLMAIIKLIMSDKKYRFGLPVEMIENFSLISIIEWYLNRSHINPLKLLDPARKATDEDLNSLLHKILDSDPKLYLTAPLLNAEKLISIIRLQKLGIPILVYSEQFEPNIEPCLSTWSNTSYIYGPFEQVITKVPNNSSFIFSNIEYAKRLIDSVKFDTLGSIMIASDYYYNFKNKGIYKYDFIDEMVKHQAFLLKFKSINIFNRFEVIKTLGEILR